MKWKKYKDKFFTFERVFSVNGKGSRKSTSENDLLTDKALSLLEGLQRSNTKKLHITASLLQIECKSLHFCEVIKFDSEEF